jgi:ribosomal-protein-alanine N-acetyltransferase
MDQRNCAYRGCRRAQTHANITTQHDENLVKTADVAVRLARASDAADIAVMSRDYIEQGLPWTWTAGRVDAAIHDPEINVVVVGERNAISAFGIMSYPDDDAHLLLFAVRRNQQRRGVGSAVLRWLEEAARTAGATRIRVECRRDNVAARNFYCEHAYQELSITSRFYRGLKDGIHLVKWLQPPNETR